MLDIGAGDATGEMAWPIT